MLFTQSFTIGTDNTIDNPLIESMPIAHGIITSVSVLFPSGCHGLVYCKLKHHEHSVFPSQEDMFLMSDTRPIEWNEFYESYQPPYELKFIGWSYGCSYAHVITVRIAVLPRKAVLALAIIDTVKSMTDAIKALLRQLSPKRIYTSK